MRYRVTAKFMSVSRELLYLGPGDHLTGGFRKRDWFCFLLPCPRIRFVNNLISFIVFFVLETRAGSIMQFNRALYIYKPQGGSTFKQVRRICWDSCRFTYDLFDW